MAFGEPASGIERPVSGIRCCTMRLPLKAYGLLAATALISACGGLQGSATAVPVPLNGGSVITQSIVSQRIGSAPGVSFRRVCELDMRPEMMTCQALIRTDIVNDAPPDVVGYGPSDLQSAYNLPSSTRGKGVTVAVVDAYGYPAASRDLATYRSYFSLPTCRPPSGCFKKLNQQGKPGPYPSPSATWDVEQALDIEMVSAACPNCNIMLVEANSGGLKDLGKAVDEAVKLGATIVSNSYGYYCHKRTESECGVKSYNHPGAIVVAASGDYGYWGNRNQFMWVPAGLPEVVAVGGTTLLHAGIGLGRASWAETVWYESGSGCTPFPKPKWQHDRGCPGRTANDTAADADLFPGVAVYEQGSWQVDGGTSAAAQIIAGAYGLAGNATSLGAAQSLYERQNRAYLNNVIFGTNGVCAPAYLCTARRGYNGPSGWGTPNGVEAY